MKGAYTYKESHELYPGLEDEIKIAVGEDALEILSDETFQAEWNRLYQTCYWSTVFQNATFVNAWYKHYKKHHIPILINSYRGSRLTGMLNLCMSLRKLEITGTGKDDAHYHTWLAEEYNKESFITGALQIVREHFPGYNIRLYQLPQHTPLNWLKTDKRWKELFILKSFDRPLVDLSHPELPKLYTKKQFKENRNRLKRLGEVTFEHLDSPEQLETVFDEMIDQYDFRKGATLNLLPFRSDPLKKAFFMELFRLKMLHITVLKLNDEIVASLIGTIGKDKWIHGAGINTHAPTYARYSPGFISFILMTQQLASEKFQVLDLSTGDQAYKKRIANLQDQVYELIILDKPKSPVRLPDGIKKPLLQYMSKSGFDYTLFRARNKKRKVLLGEKWQLLRQQKVKHWPLEALRLAGASGKEKLYKIKSNKAKISNKATYVVISRNSISDLLQFEAGPSLKTRWEFLEEAMTRLEIGDEVFTWTENNVLKACIWLSSCSTSKNFTAAKLHFPESSMLLHRLYYQPDCKSKLTLFFEAVLAVLNSSQLYLMASASDAVYCGLDVIASQQDMEPERYVTAQPV